MGLGCVSRSCLIDTFALSQTLTLTPDDALEVRIDLMDFLKKIKRASGFFGELEIPSLTLESLSPSFS